MCFKVGDFVKFKEQETLNPCFRGKLRVEWVDAEGGCEQLVVRQFGDKHRGEVTITKSARLVPWVDEPEVTWDPFFMISNLQCPVREVRSGVEEVIVHFNNGVNCLVLRRSEVPSSYQTALPPPPRNSQRRGYDIWEVKFDAKSFQYVAKLP